LVIDVGSTKARVVADLEPLVPPPGAFIGCHPIAGSEQRGVSAARADLFCGAVCIITPTSKTPPEAAARVEQTWKALGLAEVSHLPHVVASALVRAVSGEAEPFVGPGWADTTRVASGDAALWRDILMSNAAEVAAALERFQGALAAFRSALAQGDAAKIESLLAESKARRDSIKRTLLTLNRPS
jgi:prephenate dehydrogenase